jgi:isoquinoline 1-oxidoreductase alpha subunit
VPRYTIEVNGKKREVDAPADMPLLWVLRDRLGLTGTKYGCGQGICGSCTVHVGAEAVRSCQAPISAIGSERITTIEGLAAPQLKQAWIVEDVAQCGFCQAGQIMQAAALLGRTPNPADDEIVAAMNDNLCRCGTYLRIRAAIRRAAEIEGKYY